jgi:hypothetical protein
MILYVNNKNKPMIIIEAWEEQLKNKRKKNN